MSAPERPVLLEADDLAVVAKGRQLLAPSSFAVREGDRVLLVGPSGSGKSLFVDLLLGFAGPETAGLEVSGRLEYEGRDALRSVTVGREPEVGAVFQVHAPGLFDDLTVEQNLRFGSRDEDSVEAMAERLALDQIERRAVDCSGGERVRVVLGRTLLRGARVLVFDEPTAGLDAGAVTQVVRAVEESHDRLTLVVTHDYDAFRDFADVVLFLDPSERRIRPVAEGGDSLAEVRRGLETAAPPPPRVPPEAVSRRRRLARGWLRAAETANDTLLDALAALAAPLAWLRFGHALDGPRVRTALRRHLAPGVAAFIATSAALAALTSTYFLFERLPQRPYAEALFLDDILGGLGVVLVRVALPLLVSVLLAAKLGASAAAHLGHMSLTRQVDALRMLGVPLRRHLLSPLASGQLVAAWVFTLLAALTAFVTSLVVFLWAHPGWSALYFHDAWTKELEATDALWLAAKVGASALAVAAVAFRAGTAPKRAPGQVVEAIHATLLRALLVVLVIHAVFAFLEFT